MIEIRPFTEEWSEAVRHFNQRLDTSDLLFPEEPAPDRFVAVDGDAVRGGYILRRQRFWVRGEEREVAHYRLPLSEGIVNRAYTAVGVHLLRDALRRQPMLYALGMGGAERPLPQMLKAAGWTLWPVPFYFKIVRPFRFLRQIRPPRRTRWRRLAMDLAAFTGAGWMGARILQPPVRGAARPELMHSFADSADDLWQACRGRYDMIAQRDAVALNGWYPPSSDRFVRLRAGESGWALVLDTTMRDDAYFGDLRLGSIADCLAAPDEARPVVAAATAFLESRGVDLIVSNQLHTGWGNALRAAGFRQGPTNFIFAASKKLAEWIEKPGEVHMNRGDGDGPIHL